MLYEETSNSCPTYKRPSIQFKEILLIIYLSGTSKTNLSLFSLTKAFMFDNEKKKKNKHATMQLFISYLLFSTHFNPVFQKHVHTHPNTTHKS